MDNKNYKKIYECKLCNKKVLHKSMHNKSKSHIKQVNAAQIKEKYFVISTDEYDIIKTKLDNILIELLELKNKE
jgi:hypothetical protein